MGWYISKIVFRIVCGNGNHTPQFDEQLRLISAADEKTAISKAKKLGVKEQDSFFNDRQQLVKWEFITVSEMHRISEWSDGAEIYSRIEENVPADTYIGLVKQRAAKLQPVESRKLLELA